MTNKILAAAVVILMMFAAVPLMTLNNDDVYSALPSTAPPEFSTVDTVPAGWVPIYDYDDLMKIGSGVTQYGSMGDVQYDWLMSDQYILMADLDISSANGNGGVQITLQITMSGGNIAVLMTDDTSSQPIDGIIWLDQKSYGIAAGSATFAYDPGIHTVVVGGTAGAVPFAYSFEMDSLSEGGSVTKTFDSNGNFDSIGSSSDPFTGKFNGNGHSVTGMKVSVYSETLSAGMFGAVSGAEIYNFKLESIEVTGASFSSAALIDSVSIFAGGIAGQMGAALVRDCYVAGSVNASVLRSVDSTFTSSINIGGVAGQVRGQSVFERCEVDISVSGSDSSGSTNRSEIYAGGIAGYLQPSAGNLTISDCLVAGSVSASGAGGSNNAYSGGMTGYAAGTVSNAVNIDRCTNQSAVSSYSYSEYSTTNSISGGMAGLFSEGSVSGSYNSGAVSSKAGTLATSLNCYAGGIAGRLYSASGDSMSVSECLNTGTVHSEALQDNIVIKPNKSNLYSGGIVGQISTAGAAATVEKCENKGNVSSMSDIHMIDSWSTVDVMYNCSGGIVGLISTTGSSTKLSACKNSGTVKAETVATESILVPLTSAAGIVAYTQGMMSNNTIEECSNTGSVESKLNAGVTTTFTNRLQEVDAFAGGIAGLAYGITLRNCSNDGPVNLDMATTYDLYILSAYVGGLSGYINSASVEECANNASVNATTDLGTNGNNPSLPVLGTVPTSSVLTGGAFGFIESTSVSKCSNTGNITASAKSEIPEDNYSYVYAGGMAGFCSPSSSPITFTQCNNSGHIDASSESSDDASAFAGGMVGYIDSINTSIDYCYNTGGVNAVSDGSNQKEHSYAGGIIGSTIANGTDVRYVYNTGTISATSAEKYAAGIIGQSLYSFTSRHAIALNTSSDKLFGTFIPGNLDDVGSSLKTEQEMKDPNTYQNWPGFNKMWLIDGSTNGGYPFVNESLDTHVISFDVGGGIYIDDVTATYGDILDLPTPVKEGFVFKGWYTGPNGTGSMEASLLVKSDTTLYALWGTPGQEPSDGWWVMFLVIVILLVTALLMITLNIRNRNANKK